MSATNCLRKVLQESFKTLVEKNTFEKNFSKLRIISGGDGKCLSEMRVEDVHQNRNGFMHGAVAASLIDIVSTMALITNKTDKVVPGVSVNMSISYLNGAKVGEEILIQAETVKSGKNLAFLKVEILNKNTRNLLVIGQHTKYLA